MRSVPRFDTLAGWLDWQQTLHPNAIELGLDRVRRVLDRTGWTRPAQPVITVGGTNGKGSCVALLEATLRAAGLRVATFTSPHLIDYRERIRIDDADVSATSLMVAFERIAAGLAEDTLTFFEFNTLAALLVFETARPDAIVLEVGMGGRLDAVNVVDADVALVASVGLDHTEWLGHDLAAIAREKAGIFRRGRPAVYGSPTPQPALVEAATLIGARLKRRDVEFGVERSASGGWSYTDPKVTWRDLPPPALAGRYQLDNAAAVLAALAELDERLPIDRAAIVAGLSTAFVPARFQRASALGRTWILDVTHNPDAARALAQALAATPCTGRTVAVAAMLADKDVEAVLLALREVVDDWRVAPTAGGRGLSAAALAARAASVGVAVSQAASIEDALRDAAAATTGNDRIVVFGSFHTVGPAIEWLRTRSRARDRWLRDADGAPTV
jgi:dihydrofolate synthase/folylpolyglutamate synthase